MFLLLLRVGFVCSGLQETFVDHSAPGGTMGTHGPGRKRIPNREKLTAEDDALNQIAREVRLLIDTVIDMMTDLMTSHCGSFSSCRYLHFDV